MCIFYENIVDHCSFSWASVMKNRIVFALSFEELLRALSLFCVSLKYYISSIESKGRSKLSKGLHWTHLMRHDVIAEHATFLGCRVCKKPINCHHNLRIRGIIPQQFVWVNFYIPNWLGKHILIRLKSVKHDILLINDTNALFSRKYD